MSERVAERRAEMPVGSERMLDSRRLAWDHRSLARLLKPGLVVLDVGCGSGAITRGIAEAVAPGGTVVGIDVSDHLIARARTDHADKANLRFELSDVTSLGYRGCFDIVTTARVLQWLADPLGALESMCAALKPSGQIVVLDYNHAKAHWEPEPPEAFRRFYAAFLRWRAEAGMDNEIADHLAAMLTHLGMEDVRVSPEHEITNRGDPGFETQIVLWRNAIATRGHQIVADGVLDGGSRAAAEEAFGDWIDSEATRQSLHLLCATASKAVDEANSLRA